MSSNEAQKIDETKKVKHRKPLWLIVPAGVREVEQADGVVTPEQLYTVHKCANPEEIRKIIAAMQIDVSNIPKGMMILRADPKPLDIGAQLVVKF